MCEPRAGRQPLQGLRVLDCTGALPGPFATQLLADLGACVLKLERPPSGEATRVDMPSLFETFNRGKHSVVLDLKSEDGVRGYERLARHADVLVEGFRPGVMERLGLGEARTRELNPDLIYVSISGWGKTGELANMPGHDLNYLGMTGALRVSADGVATPGVLVADLASGSIAAVAILAAVIERDRTGKGAAIDLGMADVALNWAASANAESLFSTDDTPSTPHEHTVPGHGIFKASDGEWISLGVIEDKFFQRFKKLAEDARLESPRFESFEGRRDHSAELREIIIGVIAERPASYWFDGARSLDVPLFPVLSFAEALTHDHFRRRGIVGIEDGRPRMSFPAVWDDRQLSADGDAPAPGESDVDDMVTLWR